jgi:4-hydroxy-3-methylbut-2-enyl diphosphate reductase
VPSYLIDDHREVRPEWLARARTVALTAGASAPEHLVQELISALRDQHGFTHMEEVTLKDEDVRFSLPQELAAAGQRLHSIATL